MTTLIRYDETRGVEILGAMWTLRTREGSVVCTLMTHPEGWELQVWAGETLDQSAIIEAEADVLEMSDEWRRAWESKVGR